MCSEIKGEKAMTIGLMSATICFLVSLILSPLIIKKLQKLKAGQNILIYVEQHKDKSGTPTMGGIIFVLASCVGYLLTLGTNNTLATIAMMSLVFFGCLGFLDDFIKIKFKQNEGLKPYQKIIGQVGLSLIIAIYIYMSDLVGSKMIIPFFGMTIDVGYWIIPIVVIFFLAVSNSVNLIDGLDGLCGGVSSVVLFAFSIVILNLISTSDGVYLEELNNIYVVTLSVFGGVLGFLCFNMFPARVFMGDTGSLALGGFLSSIFSLTKEYFLIALIGFAYVMTTISVILQVLSFKLTKKRIFKMTPIHHHFEQYIHESKVTNIYIIVTIVISILTISLII